VDPAAEVADSNNAEATGDVATDEGSSENRPSDDGAADESSEE